MTQSDSHLFKLTSLLFNAALGKTYYSQFSNVLEQSGIEALATAWGDSDVAKSLLGTTPEAQAKALTQNLGLDPTSVDQQSADYIAYSFFLSNLQAGMNVGSLALAAVRYLEQDEILPSLETTRAYLNNRAEVAYQFSVDMGLGGTDVAALQAALDGVTENEYSIDRSLDKAREDAFAMLRASSPLAEYSSDDEEITGTLNSDYIDAQAGNDVINGGDGADIIIGGSGDDQIFGGRGSDILEGGIGEDSIEGGEGDDSIDGGAGNDVIHGGQGNDTIKAGINDSMYEEIPASGADTVDGGEGDDQITVYRSADTSESDEVIAGEGRDIIKIYVNDGDNAGSSLMVDLTEEVAMPDHIAFEIRDMIEFADAALSPVEVKGFDVEKDTLSFDARVNLFGDDDDWVMFMQSFDTQGDLSRNFVQIVDSPDTPWATPVENPSNPDEYGKAFFVIQGGIAASSSAEDVASFIDEYGDNATYSGNDSHYFFINVNETDMGIYLFADDMDADDRVVADEITPLVILTGVTTEDLNQNDRSSDFLYYENPDYVM